MADLKKRSYPKLQEEINYYKEFHIKRFCRTYTQGSGTRQFDIEVASLMFRLIRAYGGRLLLNPMPPSLVEDVEEKCLLLINKFLDIYFSTHLLKTDPFSGSDAHAMGKRLAAQILKTIKSDPGLFP